MSSARSFSSALCLVSSLALAALAGCADDLAIDEDVTDPTAAAPVDGLERAPRPQGKVQPSDLAIGAADDLVRAPQPAPASLESRLYATATCVKGQARLTVGYHVGTPAEAAALPSLDGVVATLSVGEKWQAFELAARPDDLAAQDRTQVFSTTIKPGASFVADCDRLAEAHLRVDLMMNDGAFGCRIEGPASQPRHVECSQ